MDESSSLPGITLIYFSHDTCQVCKVLKPKVEDLVKKEYPRVKFAYVDIGLQPKIAGNHAVFTVPTLILMADGKEMVRFSRSFGLDQLKDKLERYYTLYYE